MTEDVMADRRFWHLGCNLAKAMYELCHNDLLDGFETLADSIRSASLRVTGEIVRAQNCEVPAQALSHLSAAEGSAIVLLYYLDVLEDMGFCTIPEFEEAHETATTLRAEFGQILDRWDAHAETA